MLGLNRDTLINRTHERELSVPRLTGPGTLPRIKPASRRFVRTRVSYVGP